MDPVEFEIFAYTSVPAVLSEWFGLQPDGQRDVAARQVALQLGCSRALVWNMVSGKRRVRLDHVPALARAMGLSEEGRDYLGRLVRLENAPPDQLKDARLAMWEAHAAHAGIPAAEIDAMLAREAVPGAAEGALSPLIAVVEACSSRPSARDLSDLLLAPPSPAHVASALQQAADGFLMGELVTPRLLCLDAPGLPNAPETAAWHGFFDLAREGLLRVAPELRDYHAVTWSSDARGEAEVAAATTRLGRDLKKLVRRSAQAPVGRLQVLLVQQLRLTDIMGSPPSKKRPGAATEAGGLPVGPALSRIQEGSPHPCAAAGEAPCLYLHLTLKSYTSTWREWRTRHGEPCSVEWLARRMKVSRTLASDLCTGMARFRPEHVEGAAHAFGWSEDEKTYAEGMARLGMARTDEDRSRLRQALFVFASAQGMRTTEGESFRATSHWAPMAVHALSFLPNFSSNPAWISLALRGRIRWQDAQELTQVLLAAGQLAEGQGGVVRPQVYKVVDVLEQPGLSRYALHDSILRQHQGELRLLRPDQLPVGWVLALPETAMAELRALLDRYKAEVAAIYQAADARAEAGEGRLDRVMQASFQLFPVTMPLTTQLAPHRP